MMVQEFFYCWKVAKNYIESNFVGVNRLFALIYPNQDNNSKSYKAKRYYIPKGVINNYNDIIKGKSFYDQPNDSGIQWYKEKEVNNKPRWRPYYWIFAGLWIHQKPL